MRCVPVNKELPWFHISQRRPPKGTIVEVRRHYGAQRFTRRCVMQQENWFEGATWHFVDVGGRGSGYTAVTASDMWREETE